MMHGHTYIKYRSVFIIKSQEFFLDFMTLSSAETSQTITGWHSLILEQLHIYVDCSSQN